MTTQEQAFVLAYLFYGIPKYYAVPKYAPARASNPSALFFCLKEGIALHQPE